MDNSVNEQMINEKLILSFSPHIRDNSSTNRIMLDVIIALLPTTAVGIYFFGVNALVTIIACVLSAVLTEAIIQKLCKRKVTVCDLSAVVTGLLLALNMPSGVPLYIPIVGGVFAIGICKQCFGGLGNNFVNPALAARVFLMMSWPLAMTTWPNPGAVDTIASATPMAILKTGEVAGMPTIMDMFIGNIPGCVGEVSSIALLIGGLYLIARKVINFRIPVVYILTVAILTAFTGINNVPYHLFGGGLMLGAIFMATDYVTSPVTNKGKIIFAIGCGVLTTVIRLFGGYPEGVSFSILIMNLCTPLIERISRPKLYGAVKEVKAK